MESNSEISWENNDSSIHHSSDWYVALWIICASIAIASILLSNVLFAILILIAATAITLHSYKTDDTIHCSINSEGIIVGKTFYPYKNLESFFIEQLFNHEAHEYRLLIKSRKLFMPLIAVPIEGSLSTKIHKLLAQHLPNEEMHETAIHHLMEYIGL